MLLSYLLLNFWFLSSISLITLTTNIILISFIFISFNCLYFVTIYLHFLHNHNYKNLKDYSRENLQQFKSGFIVNLHLNWQKNNFKFHYLGQQHTLVIGSTGSGKTQSLVLPNIFINILSNIQSNLVIVDLKGEIFRTLAGYLKYFNYQYFLFDFVNFNFHHWNPLFLLSKYWNEKNYQQFEIQLDNFLAILIKQVQSKNDPIWHFSAKIFLKVHFCYLFLTVKKELTLKIFIETFSIGYLKLIRQYKLFLKSISTEIEFKIFQYNLGILLDSSNRMLPSIYLISLGALQKIATLKFLKMSASNDLNLKNNFIIFIKLDPFLETYWMLASLFLDTILVELINLRLKKLTLFFLDEFGNLPKISNFSTLISLGRGLNIYFFIILQSYDQLMKKYEDYANILANIDHHLFLHSNDLKTTDMFSKKLGFLQKKQTSISKSKSFLTYNYSLKKELQLDSYDLTMLKKDTAILKSNGLKLVLFKIKYFYQINPIIIKKIITKKKEIG